MITKTNHTEPHFRGVTVIVPKEHFLTTRRTTMDEILDWLCDTTEDTLQLSSRVLDNDFFSIQIDTLDF